MKTIAIVFLAASLAGCGKAEAEKTVTVRIEIPKDAAPLLADGDVITRRQTREFPTKSRLKSIGNAAEDYRTRVHRPPASLRELAEARLLPDELTVSEMNGYRLTFAAAGDGWICRADPIDGIGGHFYIDEKDGREGRVHVNGKGQAGADDPSL
jgi:hypothetical protein